ncbi:MAG TPA: hypothetical protein VEK15_17425 [Vicinamibacteria bacterium]|nr:hypothetical protein [Vicinamibacteria bacterium]
MNPKLARRTLLGAATAFLALASGLACLSRVSSKSAYTPSPTERFRLAGKRAKGGAMPPRFDQPGEALSYYVQKRAPVGTRTIPISRYFTARDHIRAMPRHSTALDILLPSENAEGAAPSVSALSLDTWEELGPGNVGGRTRSILIDPSAPNIMYAAGVSGGIWKTVDGGANWAPLDDFLPNLAVSTMAMDPDDANVLYAGTGEGFFNIDAVRGAGVFKSVNGGASWSQLAATSTNPDFYYVNDLIVSPNDSARVYAATGTGVFRSSNGGTSWTQVLSATVAGGCLDLAQRTDTPTDVVFASCGTLETATVYRNDDAGGTGVWTSKLSEPEMGRTSLAIAPSNQDVVYALSASLDSTGFFTHGLHAVFRSADGGNSWTTQVSNQDLFVDAINLMLLTNPAVAFGCFGPIAFYHQGWYDNVIAVDPTDPDVVWAGGIDLFRSEDGGVNWGLASHWWADPSLPQYAHADHHAIVFHPAYDGTTNTTLFVGNDGGVFRTDNATAGTVVTSDDGCDPTLGAVAWTALNNHYGVTQFYHGTPYPDGSTFFGGTQDNGTVRGSDAAGPNDWGTIWGGDGGYVAVDPDDTNVLYIENTGLSLHKSIDGGSTFQPATNGIVDTGLFIAPFTMDPSDSERLWTGGVVMWRTTDAAESWTDASTFVELGNPLFCQGLVSAIAVSPADPNRVLAGTDCGHIHRTDVGLSSGGTTDWPWTLPRDGWVSSLAFHPSNPDIAFATYSTFGGTHVWTTINGGANWSGLDGSGMTGLPDIPVHSIVVDPLVEPVGTRLYVGTDLGVFASTDGGATWAVENTGFANVVTETLALDASLGHLFAFTHGRGVWRVDITGQTVPLPRDPTPPNGAVGVSTTPILSWVGGAAGVTHDVYFGTTTNPPLVSSGQAPTNYAPGTLQPGTTYYWRVVATAGIQMFEGDLWKFTTGCVSGCASVSIGSLSPDQIGAGESSFVLTVNGASFAAPSVVRWNGSPRPTTYVSATVLEATIPSTDVVSPGLANITVSNESFGGGVSNTLFFRVNDSLVDLLHADFESGPEGFVASILLDKPDGTLIWQLTTNRGGNGGHSASTAFYFGDPADFDYVAGPGQFGPPEGAMLVSPPVPLGPNPLSLSFNYFLETEGLAPIADIASVEISSGGPFTTLADNGFPGLAVGGLSDPTTGWQSKGLDLSSYANQTVTIRFVFDTLDGLDNLHEGWYVDDVVIQATGSSTAPFVDLVLSNAVVTTTELFEASNSITAGPSFATEFAGAVTFHAGNAIVLANGFSVGPGATFTAELGPLN